MTDPFLKTASAIEDSERHLADTKTLGSVIESYLADHIVVLLCADMQQAIYGVVDRIAAALADRRTAEFLKNASRRVLRSVRKDDIATFVGLFGAGIKTALNNSVSDRDVTVYNNAVGNRHDVAHRAGSTVTFRDVKAALDAARRILAAVEIALDNTDGAQLLGPRLSTGNDVP